MMRARNLGFVMPEWYDETEAPPQTGGPFQVVEWARKHSAALIAGAAVLFLLAVTTRRG